MIDPVVHATLVVLFAALVQWLFSLVGIDIGASAYTSIAGSIVAYILSLFGYALYSRNVRGIMGDGGYKPPFT